MRWDRESEEGGCVPSMISGSDSPNYNAKKEDGCKKDVESGVLECKHNGVVLSGHHTTTTKMWKEVLPRGRVDFFMDNFCMPDITADVLDNEIQLELKERHLKAGGFTNPRTRMNVALNQPASQSSTGWGGIASRAVDGNTSGNYWHYSVTHTLYNLNASWTVKLDKTYKISHIKVWNRSDCCGYRINNFVVTIKKDGNNVLQKTIRGDLRTYEIPYTTAVEGDQVVVQLNNRWNYLQLAEVEVFADVEVEKVHRGKFTVNEYIYSPNMTYGLVHQIDNNLVLYNLKTGKPHWASNTCCTATTARLSNDGTLTISNTSFSAGGGARPGVAGAMLIVTNKGYVEIHHGDSGGGVKWQIQPDGKIKVF